MESTTILIWVAIVFIVLKRYLRSQSLPPGPIGLPVFGNFLQLAWTCYWYSLSPDEVFAQWAKRYGKVFSIRLGSKLVVVVNDVAVAKEAFMSEDITGRPVNTVLDGITGGVGELELIRLEMPLVSLNSNIMKAQFCFSPCVIWRAILY